MPINLLLFTDSLCPSGMGTIIATLLEQLDRRRYQPHLVLPRELRGSALHSMADSLNVPCRLLTVRNAGRDYDTLLRHIQRAGIGLIHVHAGVGWEGNWGTWAGCKTGVPSVRSEHLPFVLTDPGTRLEHLLMTNKVAQIIAVSESARQSFLLHGVPAHKVTTVTNGINPPLPPSTAAVAAIREQLGLTPATPLFLSVGRLDDQKGYDTLLFAIPHILATHPSARFVIVGEGPHEVQLGRLINELAIGHAVRLLGHSTAVPTLITAASAVIMPSRFEGLPLVGIEALALGTPVIGTAVPGLIDLVEPDLTGLLVPPEDVLGLAQAVLRLLDEPGLRLRLALPGPAIYRSRYAASRMAADTMRVYDQILQLPAGTAALHDTRSAWTQPAALARPLA